MKRKIAVFGTPALSARLFEKLSESAGERLEIVAAVTTPEKPQGRGQKLHLSAVAEYAERYNIPLFSPENLDIAFSDHLQQMQAEIFLVIAFGKIFSRAFLSKSPPVWNVHFSLLPSFRGASPVPAAILAREKFSGVTLFRIAPGVDRGPILSQKKNQYSRDEV